MSTLNDEASIATDAFCWMHQPSHRGRCEECGRCRKCAPVETCSKPQNHVSSKIDAVARATPRTKASTTKSSASPQRTSKRARKIAQNYREDSDEDSGFEEVMARIAKFPR